MVLPYLPLQAARRIVENIIITRGFVGLRGFLFLFPDHDHLPHQKGLQQLRQQIRAQLAAR